MVCSCALLAPNEIVMVTSLSQSGRDLGLLKKEIHVSLLPPFFQPWLYPGEGGKMKEKGNYADKGQDLQITEAKVT